MNNDGSRLWLRYDPLGAHVAGTFRAMFGQVAVGGHSPTARATRDELTRGLSALLGMPVEPAEHAPLVVGTPASSPIVRRLNWADTLKAAGPQGFVARPAVVDERPTTVVAAETEVGALYGAFHLLRLLQVEPPAEPFDVAQRPKLQLRLLNHWDNLDGTIERGYAGTSLWWRDGLPDLASARYVD